MNKTKKIIKLLIYTILGILSYFSSSIIQSSLTLIGVSYPAYIYDYNYVGILSILQIFLFAFIEEIIFRYPLAKSGNWTGYWFFSILFVPFITINPFLTVSFFYQFCGIYILVATILLSWGATTKNFLYNLIYKPNNLRNFISIFAFCLIHIGNFKLDLYNFWNVMYVVTLHFPIALILTVIRLRFKRGFLFAVVAHSILNIFTLLLAYKFGFKIS